MLRFLICLIYSSNSFAIAQDNNFNYKKYKNNVPEKIAELLEKKYVLPEKAKKFADEYRKKYENINYETDMKMKDFAEQITKDLFNITHDKHIYFRVIEASDIGEKIDSPLHHPVRYHLLGIKENKGFSKLEWIEGNIGYLDIRRFYSFADIREMVTASIKFLSNASAIIIDLRENGGGSGDYLSSYFLPYSTQLNSWYSRGDDFLSEFWTRGDIGMEPLTDVPLFLLTSDKTFSAAESFVYDMKVRQRAVIVGDSTKGGAHSVDIYQIEDHFEIYIPTVRAINPVTGTNWEGAGVIPDILVPAESALDTAIVLAKKAGEEYSRVKESDLKSAVDQMQMYLDRSEKLFDENKIEKASVELDSVFRIADKCDLINEFFIDVLAYNYLSQKDALILYAILKKKIEFFPKSPTAYESLAYAYYRNNKKNLALVNYNIVLKLDPDNRNARKMIKKLL